MVSVSRRILAKSTKPIEPCHFRRHSGVRYHPRLVNMDVAVVGLGFGGLGAALRLAERGVKVVAFEALRYPGGCASTFTRQGHAFEAGATLFSGFREGDLFASWIRDHAMNVSFECLEPAVELRTAGFHLPISTHRATFLETLTQLPGASSHRAAIHAFFTEQRRVADALWQLFADPKLLPPFGLRELVQHARLLPHYLPLLRVVGRPLSEMLRRHHLEDCLPLRIFLDAVCQITVQCSSQEAEAPFALAAMDYYFRGTGHIRGGIGKLADGMVAALRNLGAHVHFACNVTRIMPKGEGYVLQTRKGEFTARRVVLNVLPRVAAKLLQVSPHEQGRLEHLEAGCQDGWGAVMLYRVLPPTTEKLHARHVELVANVAQPFIEGNHVFCSISGTDEPERVQVAGARTMTCSTHVPMRSFLALTEAGQAETVARIQQTMRETIASRAPELSECSLEMPGSPRTFERFTQRPHGYVGGIPRRAGLHHYVQIAPFEVRRGVHLVGDTCFPGQSTLGVALGGVKIADAIALA